MRDYAALLIETIVKRLLFKLIKDYSRGPRLAVNGESRNAALFYPQSSAPACRSLIGFQADFGEDPFLHPATGLVDEEENSTGNQLKERNVDQSQNSTQHGQREGGAEGRGVGG